MFFLLRQLGPILRPWRNVPRMQHENGWKQAWSRTVSQIKRNPDEKENKRIKAAESTCKKETKNHQKEKQPQRNLVRVKYWRRKRLVIRIGRQRVRNRKRRQKITQRLIDDSVWNKWRCKEDQWFVWIWYEKSIKKFHTCSFPFASVRLAPAAWLTAASRSLGLFGLGVSLGSYLQSFSGNYGRSVFIKWNRILQLIFGL